MEFRIGFTWQNAPGHGNYIYLFGLDTIFARIVKCGKEMDMVEPIGKLSPLPGRCERRRAASVPYIAIFSSF